MYMILCFGNEQVLSQLPKDAPPAFSFEKEHEMHEIRQHQDTSFTSGAEGLSSVMWHDIVQVNDNYEFFRQITRENPHAVKLCRFH